MALDRLAAGGDAPMNSNSNSNSKSNQIVEDERESETAPAPAPTPVRQATASAPVPAATPATPTWQPARIVVTIPTYNEVENIGQLIEQVLVADPRIEVVVADDSSPDGTSDLVEELAGKDRRVHLLRRTREFGRGYAGRDAFAWALAHDADIVIEMDADFSHHPRHIPTLIKALDNADVVMGSRQVRGGRDLGRPAWRVVLTKASNMYVRWVLGVSIRDCNSGFRAFRRSSLEAIDAGHATSPGPAIVHELLYKSKLRKLRLVEVPIEFKERERGTSTLTFRKLMRSYVTILKLKARGLTGRLFPRSR
jgi:dolichol-phosphate mannosyltransferase